MNKLGLMEKVDVIRAWKDAKYRSSLSEEQLKSIESNPAGEAIENLDIFKGGDSVVKSSAGDNFQGCGWLGSVSGECNGGKCCNPFYSWL